ncbi:MAG: tandem-95 repeat protein [Sphingobacterium sp.]|nr:tandem-95 repeat protein [Sphingobacterium sp.]
MLYGSWSVSALGVVTFTPATNYSGNASLTYTVNDNDSNTSNTGTLLVTVFPVNDAPTAVNDATTTPEDTQVTINVTANDTDVDGTIDITTVDLNTVTAGRQTAYSVAGQGAYLVDDAGVVTFTPELNFNGIATPVNYNVKDNTGQTSASATITITVTSVIDPAIAQDDVQTTNQNIPVTINVTTNDIGVDAPVNVASVDLDPLTPAYPEQT